MAVTSDVSICNSALAKVGAGRILSLTEDSKEARLCAEQYPKVRDAMLRGHPWNFAVARKSLAQVTTYTVPYEYEFAYFIPLDVLRILSTDLNFEPSITERPWVVEIDPNTEDKLLLTNVDAVAIRYIKSVSEARFDKNFAEALAYALAADLAYALTQSTTMAQLLDAKAQEKLREIRSYDAQEGSLPQVEANEWLLARL